MMTTLHWRWLRRVLAALTVVLCAPQAAQAHLMVAQHGTLNMVGDGAFMVLSLPVSAFDGIDDDGDGKLSAAEFVAHGSAITAAVQREVQLLDERGPRPLQGLMLAPATPDDQADAPAPQVVVMGRFALLEGSGPLSFRVGLFGKVAEEQAFRITTSRASKTEKHLLVLTPQQPVRALFPPWWSVFADFVVLGAQHIVTGIDHLLFLLVVLAAGWGWRQVVLALTAFTVGHALTLVVSVFGGLSLPALVVEPAIAATIVSMAVFDLYAHRSDRRPSPWLRLSLVFACALVHGLGLASALTELGLDGRHQWLSLVGFNVGIELAQLAVAMVLAVGVMGLQRLRSEAGAHMATRLAAFSAVSVGTFWFVERVLVLS